MTLTVVILTRDEERHIERAIASVAPIANRVLVIDSGSTDRTVALAEARGARVLTNPWTCYASQFNWALDQLPEDTDWVLRLDADEVVTPALAAEIKLLLPELGPEFAGVRVWRRMTFLGRTIRHGGVFPIRVIRLFRHGRGYCEDRWMDEHILVDGAVADIKGDGHAQASATGTFEAPISRARSSTTTGTPSAGGRKSTTPTPAERRSTC